MSENQLNSSHYDDEIDLIELIGNLWKEKKSIIIATTISTILGVLFAFSQTPVYEGKIQILAPSASSLSALNDSYSLISPENQITVDPESALSKLLIILESDAHTLKLLETEKQLIAETWQLDSEKIDSESLSNKELYSIRYPSSKKDSTLKPEILELTVEGNNIEGIKNLINSVVSSSTDEWLSEIEKAFHLEVQSHLSKNQKLFSLRKNAVLESRQNTITRLTEEQNIAIEKVTNELNTTKNLIIKTRKDKIEKIKAAIGIAENLGYKKPVIIKGFESNKSNTSIQEALFLTDPLYLRGSDFLKAELEDLESLSNDDIADPSIRRLEAELEKLGNNPTINSLKNRKNDIPFNEQLQKLTQEIYRLENIQFPSDFKINFTSSTPTVDDSPIKPNKKLIVIISFILGGMIGLFIAIGRIIYRNYQAKTA